MTNYRVIFDITWTHLHTRLKQTSVAALGVTFGIGTFIIMMGFMTGLNGLLDGLVLNRTPHIHIYNEIKPTEVQPIQLDDAFAGDFNIIRNVKPKESLVRIHNALPLISELKKDKRVRGVTAQATARVFYVAGSIELNGIVNGIDVMEQVKLFNFGDRKSVV